MDTEEISRDSRRSSKVQLDLMDRLIGILEAIQVVCALRIIPTVIVLGRSGRTTVNTLYTGIYLATHFLPDPMFYLHHAVRCQLFFYTRLLMYVLKMTDKVYYDWQHRHPENFYSFHGGATQNLSSWETYSEYPNGQAPWLKVCFPSANFPPILKLWTVL